ncbi:hypothetical protein [Streptomyces sp. NBC_01353]|uniref:hypothetical protein n=1 Tax=Streptomyces sp. NBC_01353 TaxID=2903835 RepID=UPI002E324CBB|nr:hypothetical protein [Streptomyces sp. NBC_01353]
MADWATYVVVPEDGAADGHEVYEARFGAVGLDLDLLAGPDVVVPLLRSRSRVEGRWRDDGMCEAGALVDLRSRTLLFFAREGPVTQMRHRAATWELLRRAWPGWELRWTYDGSAELAARLGLDPEEVREPHRSVYPEAALDLDDDELEDPDPLVRVVTIGGPDTARCHLLSGVNDHPITEGPSLVDRLADAPDHGVYALAADSGIHVDPARRRVGWWLLDAVAGAPDMAGRWPGWTVEFWQDQWEEHVRMAGGRFVPPAVVPEQARAEVRSEALEHWSPRPPSPSDWVGWMRAASPESVRHSVTAALSGDEHPGR